MLLIQHQSHSLFISLETIFSKKFNSFTHLLSIQKSMILIILFLLLLQVQALRSFEFYICYYGWGDFKHRHHTCGRSDVYKTFYFIVAVIPYWSRLLQVRTLKFLLLISLGTKKIHNYNGIILELVYVKVVSLVK